MTVSFRSVSADRQSESFMVKTKTLSDKKWFTIYSLAQGYKFTVTLCYFLG